MMVEKFESPTDFFGNHIQPKSFTPGHGTGIEFEKQLLKVPGTPDENYRPLAQARQRFEDAFHTKPHSLLTHPKSIHEIPFYVIDDIAGETNKGGPVPNVDRSSPAAMFFLVREPRSTTFIHTKTDMSALGVVNRLTTMELGMATDGTRYWLVEEPVDGTLADKLAEARARQQPGEVDKLLLSLARTFRRIDSCGLEPKGLCNPEHYVVVGEDVLVRKTSWKRSEETPGSGAILQKIRGHGDVAATLGTFMQDKRERDVLMRAIYGRPYKMRPEE